MSAVTKDRTRTVPGNVSARRRENKCSAVSRREKKSFYEIHTHCMMHFFFVHVKK